MKTMESLSPNDLVVVGIIGRGVSSVVKLARYERQKDDDGLDQENNANNGRQDPAVILNTSSSSSSSSLSNKDNNNQNHDETTPPVYYALKIFPLCREVNRNDAKPCYYQNHDTTTSNDNDNDDDSTINAVQKRFNNNSDPCSYKKSKLCAYLDVNVSFTWWGHSMNKVPASP